MREASLMKARAAGIDLSTEIAPPAGPQTVMSLDISSKCGWAVSKAGILGEYGCLHADGDVLMGPRPTELRETQYPWFLMHNIMRMKEKIRVLVMRVAPDVIVIEQTNLGRSRSAQKYLEGLHFCLLASLHVWMQGCPWPQRVVYLDSRAWRSALGLRMTKEDVKRNAAVRKIKGNDATTAEAKSAALKALGHRGKVTKKHLALRYCLEKRGLSLQVQENDIADAICLLDAYAAGAQACTGMEPG